jgi:hypothetical protein
MTLSPDHVKLAFRDWRVSHLLDQAYDIPMLGYIDLRRGRRLLWAELQFGLHLGLSSHYHKKFRLQCVPSGYVVA